MRMVGVDWNYLAQDKGVASTCKCRHGTFGFHKMGGVSGLAEGVLMFC